MIKIEIPASAIQKHLDTWVDSVGEGLDYFISRKKLDQIDNLTDVEIKVLRFFKEEIPLILEGKPAELVGIQQEVEKILKGSFSDIFKKVLNKVFDYDTFQEGKFIDWAQIVDGATQRKRGVNGWGACEFIEALDLRVCPYCNRSYIFSVKKKTKQIKADLDHFFDKATYPYLAISLYNLIPCCQACNSRAKGMAAMSLEKHCHPYVDNFHELVKFSIKMENVRDF